MDIEGKDERKEEWAKSTKGQTRQEEENEGRTEVWRK